MKNDDNGDGTPGKNDADEEMIHRNPIDSQSIETPGVSARREPARYPSGGGF